MASNAPRRSSGSNGKNASENMETLKAVGLIALCIAILFAAGFGAKLIFGVILTSITQSGGIIPGLVAAAVIAVVCTILGHRSKKSTRK